MKKQANLIYFQAACTILRAFSSRSRPQDAPAEASRQPREALADWLPHETRENPPVST